METIYNEVGYVEDIGHTTQRKDNTADQRRRALRLLIKQARLNRGGSWHPPMITLRQEVIMLMDMLGIQPDWLLDEVIEEQPTRQRAVPHVNVMRAHRV